MALFKSINQLSHFLVSLIFFSVLVIILTMVTFSEQLVLTTGLSILGYQWQRQERFLHNTALRRFRAGFGVSPQAVFVLLEKLMTSKNDNARIEEPSVKWLLVSLFFLKVYLTETLMAGTMGHNEKTIRNQVWKYIAAIKELSSEVVSNIYRCALLHNLMFLSQSPAFYPRRLFGP